MFAAHRFAQAHNGVSTSGVKAVDSARCTCRVLVETKVIRGLDKPLKRGDKARRTDPDRSGTLTILATIHHGSETREHTEFVFTPRMASWRSGDAADCKSVNAGSIPALASNKINMLADTS